LYLPKGIITIKEERKEGEGLGHVECMWHAHGVIRNP